MEADEKICPFCKEAIKKDATICRYCKESQNGLAATVTVATAAGSIMLAVAVLAYLLLQGRL